MTDIKEGTMVSFIDPVTQLPVKGIVELAGSLVLGVKYKATRKVRNEKGKEDGEKPMPCWVNIARDKVFVIR